MCQHWCDYESRCTCEVDPLYTFEGIIVQVHSYPISCEPRDCTFRIRIWYRKGSEPALKNVKVPDFDELYDISISAAEDPRDLERMYGKILREHPIVSGHITESGSKKSGIRPTSSYLLEFQRRVNEILSLSSTTDRMPVENDHLTKRNKGFSHARP